MIWILATAAWGTSVDAQLVIGMRAGGVGTVERPVWRGLVFATTLGVVNDQYWLAPQTFSRRLSLRTTLLPGIGFRHRAGARGRTDLFGTWHVGPEFLVVDEEVAYPQRDVSARYQHTGWKLVSGLRLGVRARWSDHWGVVTSLWTPTFSGEGAYRLERLQLGIGVSWRP